jgi:hypothetical protein
VAVFTDDFSGTNGDDLGGRTASGGGTWTLSGGTASGAEINASNQLKGNDTSAGGSGFQSADVGTADMYVQGLILQSTYSGFPLVVGLQDNANFCAGLRLAPGIQLWQRNSSTLTQLGATVSIGTYNAADVWKVERVGTTLTVYRNGSSVMVRTAAVHTTVQTPGVVVRSAAVDPILDDFESDAVGGSGAAVGTFAGVASFAATGASEAASAGSTAGVASFAAVGASAAEAAFSFTGAASFAAVGDSTGSGGGVGTFAGTASFAGVGASAAAAAGTFAGIASFAAVGASEGGEPAADTDDGGAGDGTFGEMWARTRPLRPKSRGIPREWTKPEPVAAVPQEWKAPTPKLERAATLSDLAAVGQMRPPPPRVPAEWQDDEEDEIEMLLLA